VPQLRGTLPIVHDRASDTCPQLLALTVHELRTPVTVVAGYLRMLLRSQDEPLTDRQRKLVEEAERSCTRLAELVAQLGDLSNLDGGGATLARKEVAIFDLVADVAADVHEGRDRGVEVQVRGAVPGSLVIGDTARLRAALAALLYASAREKPGPAVILADCAVTEYEGKSWAVVRVGEEASLSLLDGAGAGKAFDEFRGGLGLLLPVARRVVEAHGGRLWSPGQEPRAAIAVLLPLKTLKN
jgi:two-component system, OmpR family, sensor histidine kinase VicK